jgi:anti-anti-sigma factor
VSVRDPELLVLDEMDNDGSGRLPIDLVVTSRPGGIAIHVHGEVDRATVGVLDVALEGADETSQLVVDLSATEFIDLGGVRALARCARRRSHRNRDLVVVAPPRSAEFILRLTPFHGKVHWVPRAGS